MPLKNEIKNYLLDCGSFVYFGPEPVENQIQKKTFVSVYFLENYLPLRYIGSLHELRPI